MITSVYRNTVMTAQQRHARRSLALFFALTIPLSAVLQGFMIATGKYDLVPLLMWVPGLVSLLVRLMLCEGVGRRILPHRRTRRLGRTGAGVCAPARHGARRVQR